MCYYISKEKDFGIDLSKVSFYQFKDDEICLVIDGIWIRLTEYLWRGFDNNKLDLKKELEKISITRVVL